MLEQFRRPSPGLEKVFGEAWNERVADAVGRLERAEDTIADSPEPERVLEELVADAATVQESAPPEAQGPVNTWVWLFVLWLAERFLADPAQEAVREAVLPLLVTLLVVVTPPDPLAAPELATTQKLEPVTTALTLPGNWAVQGLPAIVERAGPATAERMVEFFTARIRNANTRTAYAKAVTRFLNWPACREPPPSRGGVSVCAVAIRSEVAAGRMRRPPGRADRPARGRWRIRRRQRRRGARTRGAPSRRRAAPARAA